MVVGSNGKSEICLTEDFLQVKVIENQRIQFSKITKLGRHLIAGDIRGSLHVYCEEKKV